MRLDVASVLLQWATGGLLFLWVTTRRRVVGLGYGWLLRGVYGALGLGALVAGVAADDSGAAATVRDAAAAGVALAAIVALAVSVGRRGAGVRGQRAERTRRRARVAAMTGRTRDVDPDDGAEFPVALDLVAPVIGVAGLLATASVVGGPYALGVLRLLSGMLLMGAVSDAMLLGHWYLVQPGLSRAPIKELVTWCAAVWPVSFVAWCLPDGGIQVITGAVDDGWSGLLGWTWLVCAFTTIGLIGATWFALRERFYSAVMAATGLLYLAILTAFGMDLIPRAVLAP